MAATDEIDVLIIGAGSAGLMAALCAAAYGLKARIVDKRPHKLEAGHGDGFHARMLEVLDSFGLADRYTQEGNPFNHTFTWVPNGKGRLERQRDLTGRWNPPSRFTTTTLSQARTSDLFLDYIESNSTIQVERSKAFMDMAINTDQEYPVEVTLARVTDQEGKSLMQTMNNIRIDKNEYNGEHSSIEQEIIKAKYVIACDGAHSRVRQKLGIDMVGSDTDAIWGVLDIVPITDFPGARVLNTIMGSGAGLLWVPRENKMVRIYCVLGSAKTDAEGKLIRSSVTPEMILESVNSMLHPYKLTYKVCEWWAAYQVGQRVTRENIDPSGRVFLTGDAVHTHSLQAGQGMNVSMSDAYNLMWKLNLVLKGLASPNLLQTYREERLPLGQQLIDFDRSFAAIMSGRTPPPAPPGTKAAEMAVEHIGRAYKLVIHGLHVIYPSSLITASTADATSQTKQFFEKAELPPGIVTGMRMPSHPVMRHADMEIVHLGKAFASNGRFKVVIFAGNTSLPARMKRLQRLTMAIEALKRMFQSVEDKLGFFLDTIVVHTADPLAVDLLDYPALCHPSDQALGYDYDKTFCARAAQDRFGNTIESAYDAYGIDKNSGRLVVLRPDGYVAYQGGLDDISPVQTYFEGFMLRSKLVT